MKVSGFSVKFREMLVKVLEHKGERVFQSIFGVNVSLKVNSRIVICEHGFLPFWRGSVA